MTSCNDDEVRGSDAQKEYWSQALASLQFTFVSVDVSIVKISFLLYESIATVGEIRVWWRADFQSGSRVLKKVF